jgi:ferrous iron transport protein B
VSATTAGTMNAPNPAAEEILERASQLRWEVGDALHESMVESTYAEARRIADRAVVHNGEAGRRGWDQKLDRILTSRVWGFPIMILMLGVVFYITILGANYPSSMLSWLLIDELHPVLKGALVSIGSPWWLTGILIDGVFLATAWVISVMLPPMAIFFPLFTLLEDFGYLPRVAFNLDKLFKKAGAHGKQALTMSMGFGCNAAGVIATRVIESPRERLIAIVTNNFALCNGRWPTQILLATIFIGALAPVPWLAGVISAGAVVGIALLGVLLSFVVSWALSRTVLRGTPSSFSLELPPYRPPRILQTLYTSLIDRTIFVLWRAVIFAAPCGAIIWLVGNVSVDGTTLAEHLIGALNPAGILIGLNGVILLAYVVAIPANEIVVPTILMLTVMAAGLSDVGHGPGVMFELDSQTGIRGILEMGGWTLLTAVNLMLFSLIHNPCSTTIFTIWKETRSLRWTAVSTLLPVVMGLVVCFLVAQVWRLAG